MESPIDTLCSTCAAIDFKSLIYAVDDGADPKPEILLGTLEQISRRTNSCRFCAVILDALRERYKRTPPGHMSDVFYGAALSFAGEYREEDSDGDVEPEEKSASVNQEDIEKHGIPLTWFAEPIECHLAPSFFCSHEVDDLGTDEEEQVVPEKPLEEPLTVSRLMVTLSPSPWTTFSSKDAVTLQAIWDYDQPAETADTVSPKGSGRALGPLTELSMVRGWLHKCEEDHGDDCAHPPWTSDVNEHMGLRVIDVENRCIVDLRPQSRYICLSYVWGQDEKSRELRGNRCLNTENISRLTEVNGLDTIAIPKTIQDAIALTRHLGERYLWVDALCIKQDDLGDLDLQTSWMDLIYSSAVLTIIVACGEDSNAGLSGLSGTPRDITTHRIRLSPDGFGLTTIAALSNTDQLPLSTWNKRGWTFQERLLSRRALVFTPSQVYWLCESATWDEETILEPDVPSVWLLPQALGCNDEWDDGFPKFSKMALGVYVAQYNVREFTFAEDVFPAFLGIVRRCEALNEESICWGLMTHRFDQELVWKSGKSRREMSLPVVFEGEVVRYVPHPSWSWLGWSGFIGSNLHNEALAERTRTGDSRSEIVFYSLMSDGSVRPVGHGAQPEAGVDGSEAAEVKMDVAWKGSTTMTDVNSNQLVVLVKSLNLTNPKNKAPPVHDTGRLVFWTSHAQAPARLKDYTGDVLCVRIGETLVELECSFASDTVLAFAPPYSPPSSKDAEIPDVDGPEEQLMDLIVISRFYAISRGAETGKLNVMVVKESPVEKGVWSRIGVVVIDEKHWLRLERDWRMVVLE